MSEMDKETICNLLREIKRVAVNASIMGALKKSTHILVGTYNRCRTAVVAQGDGLAGELFPELDPREATVDEVGAASALLAGYLCPRGGRTTLSRLRGHDEEHEDEDDDD